MSTKKASKSTGKAAKSSGKAAKSTGKAAEQDEGFVRETMRAAQAQAELPHAAVVCARLDDAANGLLRKLCEGKQFGQQTGNCGHGQCQTVEEPKIVPCLHLRWGDGPQDQLETEDTEVLCITVCNPYTNVALNDFTVQIFVRNADGTPVATLPDGTPSVQVKPEFMVCFGDIPPCDPQSPRQSCVSREVVLMTRGAKVGGYQIFVLYCFQACFTKLSALGFRVELVAS